MAWVYRRPFLHIYQKKVQTKVLPPSSAFTPPNVGSLPLQGVGR